MRDEPTTDGYAAEAKAVMPQENKDIEVSTTSLTQTAPPHNELAISLSGVSKRYRLYPSIMARVADVFGLIKMLRSREPIPEIEALHNVNIKIQQSERVAIIGRNGAGKSTLVRLISGNFTPSFGAIEVYGRISALLDMGLGFHEDFSGLSNIRSSLAYNGLSAGEFDEAVADVVEFCELGPFLHLPVKTYSAGMKARIYFAVATALKPDILVVDEVLGAGDAYFGARSADRMARLIERGSTLVLVSHNLGQILQMCERAIWIEAGRVQLDGPTAEVIDAYREFSLALEQRYLEAKYGGQGVESADRWIRRRLVKNSTETTHLGPPDPTVMPVAIEARLCDPDRQTVNRIGSAENLDVALSIQLRPGEAPSRVRPVVYLFAADGRLVDRSAGPILSLRDGALMRSIMRYAPLLIGPGEYLVTSVVEDADRNDEPLRGIVARSLRFEVVHPDPTETSLVLQPTKWTSALLSSPSEGPHMAHSHHD